MEIPRPAARRLDPIPKVAARAREAMRDLPVNAVNLMATLAHDRAVMKAVNQLSKAVVVETSVPRRQVELAVLRMGWNCRCEYEFGQHILFGRDAGLTEQEIEDTTLPIADVAWADADRAVLQVVDDLYLDDCVRDETWAEISAHFDSQAIVALIAAAGCYRLVAAFLNSVGVERDEGVPGWPESRSR
jgi:4-carboxymuconolactone decarboxylase